MDLKIEDDYEAIFRRYVCNSAEDTLRLVRSHPRGLSEGIRDDLFHVLTFALDIDEASPIGCQLLLETSPWIEKTGGWKEWRPYLQNGVRQCQSRGDVANEASILLKLGYVHQMLNALDSASDCYLRAAERFDPISDLNKLATALNRAAFVARMQRQHKQASNLVARAFAMLEPTDPANALGHMVLGWVAFDFEDWEASCTHFQTALDSLASTDQKRRIGSCLQNLASSLMMAGNLQEAAEKYKQAITIFESVEDQYELAVAQMNLGVLYLKQNEFTLALSQFADAAPVFRAAFDRLHLAMLFVNQGFAYRHMQRWHEAKSALIAAIRFYRSYGNLELIINAVQDLGLTYLEEGANRQACQVFRYALRKLEELAPDPCYDRYHQELTSQLNRALVGKTALS